MILLLPGNRTAFPNHIINRALNEEIVGWMATPRRLPKRELKDSWWAVDNDCFAHGAQYDHQKFLRFLDRIPISLRRTCLFAVVPDVFGDARATQKRWSLFSESIRERGWPLAYVAQDGLKELPKEDFDCLFIGGTTEWKLSSEVIRLCRSAQENGKWVHVGRVNSIKRMRHFYFVDSIDGTAWAIRPGHIFWALTELRRIRDQRIFNF